MAACLIKESAVDKRVLAIGGRYGGLAPCPQLPERALFHSLTRDRGVFGIGIVKAGGTGADMPPQCMSAATGGRLGPTFELSRSQRQDARPGLAKMYTVPPDRAWWPAVGAPLERGVRPQSHGAEVGAT